MKKRVLIVDDEKEIRDLFRRVLESAGYEVETAASGEEALEIIEKKKFPLLLFDLNMPGMDGIELCKRVRTLLPISIIFAITGYASLFHLHDCRQAGFDDYFIKPVSIKTLLDEVEIASKKIDRWLDRTN
ncbi:MAG: response regulator [Deltaproteobacteria bacterium]|nr:response regulator [Deltaproteobacteria bacterium]